MKSIKTLIKNNLKVYFPRLLHFLKNFKNKIIVKRDYVFNYYMHFNLTSKRKGASIIKKEKGFILSFVLNNYFTFHLRPKKASEFENLSTFIPAEKEVAIIIQGYIGDYKNFLFETLKIYKKIFPNILIIVSTWSDENRFVLEKINQMGFVVIKNDKPEKFGYGNINLQIITTKAGIDYAKDAKIRYCLKTRADCRLNKNDIFPFLKGVLKSFPLKKELKAKSRIIASSVNTCKYKIYGITDILLFGRTEDLLVYFDDTLFDESLEKNNFGLFPSIINGTPVVAETFLCARYLKTIGVELNWTLEHWWVCLKDYFCIVDSDSLDFFWKKQDWQYEKRFLKSYGLLSHRAVSFADWLALYSEANLGWEKIEYQEKWEINDNYKDASQEIFVKKSIF